MPAVEEAVRPAGPDDVDAVVALVERAYRGEVSRAGWTTEADLLEGRRTDVEAVRALLEAPSSAVLLVHVGGALRACCHVERRDGDDGGGGDGGGGDGGGRAYFGMFAVAPDAQGAGTGSRLLAAAEEHVRSRWSAGVLEMTVIAQRTELVAWYVRRGYAPTGERRPFPYGDLRVGRPLRADLEFVVLARRLG